MKAIPILALAAAACFGQTESAEQLATHMAQLMESTAVAVPGLVRASEPLKQNAQTTLESLRKAPEDPALIYRFLQEVKAYLALSDSIPRPAGFPPAADRQYAELREDLQRLERRFEEDLGALNTGAQAREADPSELKRYAEPNGKLLPAGNQPRVVFFGDSITEAWRLNEYFTGRDFVNRGIGEQTTLQLIGRFSDDVLALHPRAVLILAGTSDIARGVSARSIENNLAILGDLAKAHGVKPLFASILPVSDYHKGADGANGMTASRPPAVIQQVDTWLKEYCQREGFIYVDYYSRMIDTGGMLQNDMSDDGLHPNAKGYRVMSTVALEAIGRAVAAEQSPPGEPPKRRFRMLNK